MELIASFWIVLNECVLCYAADHRGFLQEAKSNYFKGYNKEASLAMYYWATDFKPDLTHGSIIKSEALVAVYLHYSNDVAFWISKKTEILCGPQL